ncbi:hypothetical protein E4P01_23625 [Pseudomonas sp. NCIMB 10586]|nr:hypothetical protein [Pseudomonas sp. NCIMB 10586]
MQPPLLVWPGSPGLFLLRQSASETAPTYLQACAEILRLPQAVALPKEPGMILLNCRPRATVPTHTLIATGTFP